ncbi:MAG: hypothetical protein F4X61_12030 [Rhodothermaceae bacterium]|nr:hypothetical protein [Rhodothermaceae bacterium]
MELLAVPLRMLAAESLVATARGTAAQHGHDSHIVMLWLLLFVFAPTLLARSPVGRRGRATPQLAQPDPR